MHESVSTEFLHEGVIILSHIHQNAPTFSGADYSRQWC